MSYIAPYISPICYLKALYSFYNIVISCVKPIYYEVNVLLLLTISITIDDFQQKHRCFSFLVILFSICSAIRPPYIAPLYTNFGEKNVRCTN